MLTCLPLSLCSWDFRVDGLASGPASITLDFFNEQGTITIGGNECAVRKHGPWSGHWTVEYHGDVNAEARKPNAMFRSFDLQVGAASLTVKAQSPLTRCYDILSDLQVVGTIAPAHPLTRRAFVDCSPSVPELAQLFAFWLAVVTWRRAARNNNSG